MQEYILYKATGKSLEAILVRAGHTRTYIKRHLWKYHYVLTLAINNLEKTSWVSHFKRVNIDLLTKELGGESKIKGRWERYSKQVLDDLHKADVIIRQYTDERLIADDPKSTRRRVDIKVNDNFIIDGYKRWTVPDGYTGLTRYAEAEKQKARYQRELTGIYQRIAENNARIIEFDVAGARAYADHALATKMPLSAKRVENKVYDNRFVTPTIHCHYHKVIDRFEQKDYRFSADDAEGKTNRFFWLVANSPRGMRDFVTIDGERLVEADIASSQLLIFAIYLKRYYEERMEALPDDVVKYIKLCETGQFYSYAQSIVLLPSEPAMTKELFKVTFFGRIFFSSEKKNYVWRTRFAAEFENVSRIISEFKARNYKNLPQKLSHLESEIMLHRITPRLFAEGITQQFSIHDAFYCKEADLDRIKNIITEEFQKYGVTPYIKPPVPTPVQLTSPTLEQTLEEKLAELERVFAALDKSVTVVEQLEYEPIEVPDMASMTQDEQDNFMLAVLARQEAAAVTVDLGF